jgi:UTP--glucose-1-phosphate uridylyltransferase
MIPAGPVTSRIRKVVIPAAGSGTRLLPATKQQPKEMLPVFAYAAGGQLCVKPLIQLVFESLYGTGIRQFCFVVGRGKRSIEDQFTLDGVFVEYLEKHMKHAQAREMQEFYSKVRSSSIVFVNQAEPAGFGDAVLRAKKLHWRGTIHGPRRGRFHSVARRRVF